MLGRLRNPKQYLRRGGVVVQVALFSTVIVGMGALAIDVGAMYTTRTELQAAVDASALAAAGMLAGDGINDPVELAAKTADDIAALNPVLRQFVGIDADRDIVFGSATYDADRQRFTFSEGGNSFDAVRVTVRRTSDSEGGPLNMTFAHMFGYRTKDLWASATAVLIPRDISVVIDLSGSMNDDSEFYHYRRYQGDNGVWRDGIDVNLRDIWCSLNGPAPTYPYDPGAENETEYAGDTGPVVGAMTTWGSAIAPETYSPSSDSGLWYIPRSATCTSSAARTSLQARAYTTDEITVLFSGSNDGNSTHFKNRSAVICGLASWRSGRAGGQSGGDGDSLVESGELTWIAYPSYRQSWSWLDYMTYVQSSGTAMYRANSQLRYRYGLKTYANFLLENQPRSSQTQLWATPEQPLQSVKDAVQSMINVIEALQSMDHVSLEIFAQTSRHEVNLTDQLQQVPTRLNARQAAHYDSVTNIAGGMNQGIIELTSTRARGAAKKVMVLMSDGKPNVDSSGDYAGEDNPAVIQWCYDVAQNAANAGIQIYTVSVGGDADPELMTQIAEITGGQHFHAEGTPEEYRDQLELIFRTLGGRRPVALIQ
ncbi:MAG: VWA domain-containing protein [Phycisphaerales bacterium]|nr:VWA domain-containing protein [Phycisphaerales bacterium]